MQLEVHYLSKLYKEKRGLFATGYNVDQGELIAVVAHNGAGKSTLLKMLGGWLVPDGGELLLDIPWQGHTLCRQMGLERGVAVLDKRVTKGPFRPVALVSSRATARTGFPATRQRQHDRILATSTFTSDECGVPI